MEEVVEDYPRTLAELESRFSSEQACREYLFLLRWPGGGGVRAAMPPKLGRSDRGSGRVRVAAIRYR